MCYVNTYVVYSRDNVQLMQEREGEGVIVKKGDNCFAIFVCDVAFLLHYENTMSWHFGAIIIIAAIST